MILLAALRNFKENKFCVSLSLLHVLRILRYSNGVGRTGVVLAVKSEIDRIEAEEKIDVFTTVRQMRASNPNLVYTLVKTGFCYFI